MSHPPVSQGRSISPREAFRARLRVALGLLVCVVLMRPAPASDLPPAQLYLQQAAAAARQIVLGGDQSAARREIALALLQLDQPAARDSLAGIGRPADAARVLAAVATALAATDPEAARQSAALGGRLLQRIQDPDRRLQEDRLFLQEIAALGAEAPAAVTELTPEEARPLVVAALAESAPDQALALAHTWDLKGPALEPVFARLAPSLARTNPEAALALCNQISLPALSDLTLWRIAEIRPVEEAEALIARLQDPVARDGARRSLALRQAATNLEAAQATLKDLAISPLSAQAELAVAVAAGDTPAGLTQARALTGPARPWALAQIALSLAARQPAQAEACLQEAGLPAEAVTLTAARMASTDPERALRLARALAPEVRDRALVEVSLSLVSTQPDRVVQLLDEISASPARDRVLAALAERRAREDVDAATGLLGLVSEVSVLPECRGRIAVAAVTHDPADAHRLLASLPEGDTRTRRSLEAATALLTAGGSFEDASSVAALGLTPDLARRWLLPEAARQGLAPLGVEADRIAQPYWRCLGLVDVAHTLLRDRPAPRPDPERARLIRPLLEWEGN